MREVTECLAAQHAELDALLAGLSDAGWSVPVPDCPGWDVADVVLHLAQSDAAAVASAAGRFGEAVLAVPAGSNVTVDDTVAAGVAAERGAAPAELLERWRETATEVRAVLAAAEPGARLRWVAGELSARTLATTRLAEGWIHTGDIGAAIGSPVSADDRLWHIARLAWRTIPYAFARAGLALTGGVQLKLTAPGGDGWTFGDDAAPTVVRGTALDFCLVAGRRRVPSQTDLTATGPDATAVLDLVRTYA